MKAGFWAAALALTIATCAYAGGIEDGTEGLAALNRGSYDEAIRLFTKALNEGDLSTDDTEFAYYNRGKAYLAKGDTRHAIADLKRAVQLKPDDSDAQDSLQTAMSQQGGSSVASAPATPAQAPSSGWGFLSAMAGKYYWVQASGPSTQKLFVHYEWTTPQQVLRFETHNKDHATVVGEFMRDPATGKLLEISLSATTIAYSTLQTSGNQSAVEYSFSQARGPSRQLDTVMPDGSISMVAQNYAGNAWQNGQSVTLVEVPQDTLVAEHYLKSPQ